jgi:tetratricopeptide (TPR) repeat protein
MIGGAGIVGSALLLSLTLVAKERDLEPPRLAGRNAGQVIFGLSEICRAPAQSDRITTRIANKRPVQISLSPAAFADPDPPLWNDLGVLTYPITTVSSDAQRFFDQGLRLAYAFNHAEARRSFRKAQRFDSQCAMCFWGEALVLGPNINTAMDEEAIAPAVAAASRARTLSVRTKPHERALIAALSKRYDASSAADRQALDEAYASAMADVTREFPDDLEIAVLYAEALMNVTPGDYWQEGGSEPHPRAADIVPTLEQVLARNPDHPGALHYYIHVMEDSDWPGRAEAHADRLRTAMPGAGHILHMPSHIYQRIGRYRDALVVNREAVAADERYIEQVNAPLDLYRLGYYPHNVRFLLAFAQLAGDGPTVIAAAAKLAALIPHEEAIESPRAQLKRLAPYFALATFGDSRQVLVMPDPGTGMPLAKAIWHYARGTAHVLDGDLNAARRETDAIMTIERKRDWSAFAEANVPAQEILQIASRVLSGRVAQAEGNYEVAIEQFESAAALQDSLPTLEPPYWYYWNYPVSQSLGAALLQAGRLEEAEAQFKYSLEQAPYNGWALFGLSEIYKKWGDSAALRDTEQLLSRFWIGDRRLLRISNL